MQSETCKARWAGHKDSRLSDIRKLWKAYQSGNEDGIPDLGTIYEYGLSFDYVTPGTFGNRRGYFRWQLSWGGPSDEIRFYTTTTQTRRGLTFTIDRITYQFADWFDGYNRKLRGKDEELLRELFEWFDETETTRAEYSKAVDEDEE